MRETYLIQRLLGPHSTTPYSFGGGLTNGGLSQEALDMLSEFTGFDYMGAAEYEFGAVPKTLMAIQEQREHYTVLDVQILTREKPVEGKTLSVFCHERDVPDIRERLQYLYDNPLSPRDNPYLREALSDAEDDGMSWVPSGWLELDNNWVAFTNREDCLKWARLFGVNTKDTMK